MADLTLVQGETRDIYMVLADRDGPVPSGTYTTIVYDIFSGGSVIQSCTGVQLASGRVKFSFDSTDTATPGMYSGHVRAVRGDASITFFPSERAHSVEIRESGSGTPLPPPDVDYVVSINGETGTVTLSLNDISDVDTTGFADGEVLTYDSGSGNWVSEAVAGGSAASTSAAGIVELATAAETTTGTDTARAVTPDGLAGSEYGVEVVEIMASDMTTSITTGDGKAGFMVPTKLNGWNLIRAHAGLLGAQSSSGTPTIQIRNATQTADMLSTRITIDANESTSHTAATAPVVDTANDDVATGDLIYVDVDVAGTGAKGLIIVLGFQAP